MSATACPEWIPATRLPKPVKDFTHSFRRTRLWSPACPERSRGVAHHQLVPSTLRQGSGRSEREPNCAADRRFRPCRNRRFRPCRRGSALRQGSGRSEREPNCEAARSPHLLWSRVANHGSLHLPNAMSAPANSIFPQTAHTFRPASSAFNRAGSLEIQTHQDCPPRRISPLEYALTKNAPASSLESALPKSLDLNSFRFRTYKKIGCGGCRPPLPELPAFNAGGIIRAKKLQMHWRKTWL